MLEVTRPYWEGCPRGNKRRRHPGRIYPVVSNNTDAELRFSVQPWKR